MGLDLEEDTGGVLDGLLDTAEEQDGFAAVDEAMVVGEGEVHHRSDHDLAVAGHGTVLDGMKSEDSALGRVDDRGGQQ